MATYLAGDGAHIDAPLSNLAVAAFDGGGMFISNDMFPMVDVDKQSDGYYIIDPASWLRVEDTSRSPLAAAKLGEWQVSTDTYFAQNYAFGTLHAKEALANASRALQVRQNSTEYTVQMLMRDKELRVANKVTSISNVGSGVVLSGATAWSALTSSAPISDVNTAHAFIENNTGLKANVAYTDKDTFRILQQHPDLLDVYKYTNTGLLTQSAIADIFNVDRIVIARGVYNTAKEGATKTLANIWGNNFLLAHVEAPSGLKSKTFGMTMSWRPEGFPAPMAVERYDDPEPSKKAERIESQYFADEKIVARDLSYLIGSTLG